MIETESELFNHIYKIHSGKFRRYHDETWFERLLDYKTLLLNTRDVFFIAYGVLQSFFLLKKMKPDAILLKGGNVGVPVGLAAKLFKIPFMTQDSDATPGLANRIVGRWAQFNMVAFDSGYYPYPKNKQKIIGIPVNSNLKPIDEKTKSAARLKHGLGKNSFVVFVTGGSNGARFINEIVMKNFIKLSDKLPGLQLVHQYGSGNDDQIPISAKKNRNYISLPLTKSGNDFTELCQAADLVVARAGATTIAELSALKKNVYIYSSAPSYWRPAD